MKDARLEEHMALLDDVIGDLELDLKDCSLPRENRSIMEYYLKCISGFRYGIEREYECAVRKLQTANQENKKIKYMRMKDGSIRKTLECITDVVPHVTSKDSVKEADTIEELCDEFVVFEESENNGIPLTCPKEMFDIFKKTILVGMQSQLNCWLKAAVWTDKGLQYVAKMNEKGELELL